jgi:NADH-ubiquinone oxidoreductase chain 5
MLVFIIFLPLIGFLGGGLFGRFLGRGACYLSVLNTVLAFLIACWYGSYILTKNITYKVLISPWIYSDFLKIDWGFQFDALTFIMLFIITFISSFVHLYSLEYMESDPHLIRFMSYLSLFTFFMLILVTANNLLQMFVGWEGVGLSSYLLINFWYTRVQANKSAIKAMLVNRVGDFFILIGIFLSYFVFNSLDYDIIFSLASKVSATKLDFLGYFSYLDVISLLLFFGAMGKSAQIGLHTWLPDAMEGPTPVSALIHAATMVTAGVFLIVRCSFIFELSPLTLSIIVVVGCLTTFFSSTIGLFQNDIKKIIAYSTCSQLGYMIFSCGLSSYDVAIFHLSNHAFFKALLFLGAGSIIHAINDEQDLRKMGGLKIKMYLSYSVMLIGSLALGGFPFLSGFYSKDSILEVAFSNYTALGYFSYLLGSLSVFSTAFYSTRLLYLVFLIKPAGVRSSILKAHEPGYKMLTPLIILAFFSLFSGFLTKDLFIGFGTPFWNNSIFNLPSSTIILDVEFMLLVYKILPLLLSILGSYLAYFIYLNETQAFYQIKSMEFFKDFYTFFNKKWYFDKVYNEILVQSILTLCFNFVYKEVDRGLLEQFGPYGIIQTIKTSVLTIKYNDKVTLFHFIFFMTLIFLFLVIFVVNLNFIFSFLEIFLLLTFIILITI